MSAASAGNQEVVPAPERNARRAKVREREPWLGTVSASGKVRAQAAATPWASRREGKRPGHSPGNSSKGEPISRGRLRDHRSGGGWVPMIRIAGGWEQGLRPTREYGPLPGAFPGHPFQ
jgi:hypothetical protein